MSWGRGIVDRQWSSTVLPPGVKQWDLKGRRGANNGVGDGNGEGGGVWVGGDRPELELPSPPSDDHEDPGPLSPGCFCGNSRPLSNTTAPSPAVVLGQTGCPTKSRASTVKG